MTTDEKKRECARVIEDCEYWVQKTTNPQKIKYRRGWINKAKEALKKLESN